MDGKKESPGLHKTIGEGVREVVGLYPQVHTSNLQEHSACANQLIVGIGGDGD